MPNFLCSPRLNLPKDTWVKCAILLNKTAVDMYTVVMERCFGPTAARSRASGTMESLMALVSSGLTILPLMCSKVSGR